MTSVPDTDAAGRVLSADGTPLKQSLNRALRRQKLRALALIAPLLIFVLVSFVAPILDMLFRSVENQLISDNLPQTVVILEDWDPNSGELPSEAVFEAFAGDLQIAISKKVHTRIGSRLNYEKPGISSLFRKAGRQVKKWDIPNDGPYKEKYGKQIAHVTLVVFFSNVWNGNVISNIQYDGFKNSSNSRRN